METLKTYFKSVHSNGATSQALRNVYGQYYRSNGSWNMKNSKRL